MNQNPQFNHGPRERLWMVLGSHLNKWTKNSDLMFEAGFVQTRRGDLVTPITSFHFHLENLKLAAKGKGFEIIESRDCSLMRRRSA